MTKHVNSGSLSPSTKQTFLVIFFHHIDLCTETSLSAMWPLVNKSLSNCYYEKLVLECKYKPKKFSVISFCIENLSFHRLPLKTCGRAIWLGNFAVQSGKYVSATVIASGSFWFSMSRYNNGHHFQPNSHLISSRFLKLLVSTIKVALMSTF